MERGRWGRRGDWGDWPRNHGRAGPIQLRAIQLGWALAAAAAQGAAHWAALAPGAPAEVQLNNKTYSCMKYGSSRPRRVTPPGDLELHSAHCLSSPRMLRPSVMFTELAVVAC